MGKKKATGKSFLLLFVLALFMFDFLVIEHLFSSFRLGHQPFGEALSHVCLPFLLLLFFPKSLNCYSVYREFERGVPTGHYWVVPSLLAAASKKKKRSFSFFNEDELNSQRFLYISQPFVLSFTVNRWNTLRLQHGKRTLRGFEKKKLRYVREVSCNAAHITTG